MMIMKLKMRIIIRTVITIIIRRISINIFIRIFIRRTIIRRRTIIVIRVRSPGPGHVAMGVEAQASSCESRLETILRRDPATL